MYTRNVYLAESDVSLVRYPPHLIKRESAPLVRTQLSIIRGCPGGVIVWTSINLLSMTFPHTSFRVPRGSLVATVVSGGGQVGQSLFLSCSGPRFMVKSYKFGLGLVVSATASVVSTSVPSTPSLRVPDSKSIISAMFHCSQIVMEPGAGSSPIDHSSHSVRQSRTKDTVVLCSLASHRP